ncbi:procathepsin L-like [Drosophila ficusphila]|uniref:procathepsin L-like n=1 Tax=Drosophila ficusphila TaxID=30025 RepID=UPI0007E7AC9C|nr:procathepsin L-like [Drosophila ficusphila]
MDHCLSLAFLVPFDPVSPEEWEHFKLEYNKTYQNATEDLYRQQIFQENKIQIDLHNQRFKEGEETFNMSINQFTDLKDEEFYQDHMLSSDFDYEFDNDYNNTNHREKRDITNYWPIPRAIDWRYWGAVTPVKNQGRCKSCWAFAAIGALESLQFRQTGNLIALSEQSLIDCTFSHGNHGCDGGTPKRSLKYVIKKGGVPSEQKYPYKAKDGYCHRRSRVTILGPGFQKVTYGDERMLARAVANHGPVAVSLDASPRSFKSYSSGIYEDPACEGRKLTHAVVVIGYGTDPSGRDFWLIKNSWGTKWGMGGYMKMLRNAGNLCGIATKAYYAPYLY